MSVTELDQLAFDLANAKRQEDEAKALRYSIEEQIAAVVGVKDEGTTTQKTEFYKISTTGGVTRKITDLDALVQVAGECQDKLIRYKAELNTRHLKAIQDANPALYMDLSRFIEAKPRKATVKVEEIKADQDAA